MPGGSWGAYPLDKSPSQILGDGVLSLESQLPGMSQTQQDDPVDHDLAVAWRPDGQPALTSDTRTFGSSLDVGHLTQQVLMDEYVIADPCNGELVRDLAAQIQPERTAPAAGSSDLYQP